MQALGGIKYIFLTHRDDGMPTYLFCALLVLI